MTVLEKYANGEGYGIEHVWCVFADDYEEREADYFGVEGIAIYFNYSAVEEEEEVVLKYEALYSYLKEIADSYLERHSENELEIFESKLMMVSRHKRWLQ